MMYAWNKKHFFHIMEHKVYLKSINQLFLQLIYFIIRFLDFYRYWEMALTNTTLL